MIELRILRRVRDDTGSLADGSLVLQWREKGKLCYGTDPETGKPVSGYTEYRWQDVPIVDEEVTQ